MSSTLITKPYTINGKGYNNPEGVNIEITDSKGIVQVIYDPFPKQLQFHSRDEANVLFWGGRGSGKSEALRWDAHMRALSNPGFRYLILRRTFPELEKSHLIHIGREMKLFDGKYNQAKHTAHYPNGSQGRFSHCQSEEDVLNLLSAEFAWMGFDELSTFEWEMFAKLSASVRVTKDSGLIAMVRAATNPLGPSAGKVMQYFRDKDVDPEEDPDYNPNDWYEIHANAEDNLALDLKQYRKRFSGLPDHVRKAWVDGEYVLENALFDFYPSNQGKPYHVIPDIDLQPILNSATIYRTIDAGWFPDPTVCLWIAHLGHRYIVFHEKLWYKTVASEVAEDIKAIDKQLGIKRVNNTYCDPSMDINTTADIRTVKDIYEMCGIPLEKSINDREMFASALHTALAEEAGDGVPRIQIYNNGRDGCPYLVKTIPQMRYNPKRPLAMDDHKEDHAVVALAYFLISSSSMEKRPYGSGPTILRPWMKERKTDRVVLGRENVNDTKLIKH